MTYDIYLWKRRASTTVTRGLAYLCIVENVPCEGLAPFPRKKVLARVTARFGQEPELELDLSSTHAFFGLAHNKAPELVAWFEALTDELSLELYNPQVETPKPPDLSAFESIQRAAGAAEAVEDLQRWIKEAETGDMVAMNELGNCYAGGQGVEIDPSKAISWYERAAAKGHLPALLNLAESYRCGDGVLKNSETAARLYIQAVERDRCVAAFALGEMYRDGEGVDKSADRAEEYFTTARAHRHPEAYLALKGMGRAPED